LLFLKQIVSMSRNCVIAELTYLANREKKNLACILTLLCT